MKNKQSTKKLNHDQKMEIVYICKGHKTRKESLKSLLRDLTQTDCKAPICYVNPELKKVLAVEAALSKLVSPLKTPIWDNIIDRIPYEMLVVPIGRQGFYNERSRFILDVAQSLEYI